MEKMQRMYFKACLAYHSKKCLQHVIGHGISCVFTDGSLQAWGFFDYLTNFSNSVLRFYSNVFWVFLCNNSLRQWEEKSQMQSTLPSDFPASKFQGFSSWLFIFMRYLINKQQMSQVSLTFLQVLCSAVYSQKLTSLHQTSSPSLLLS